MWVCLSLFKPQTVFKTAIAIMSSGTDIMAIANGCLNIRESYKIFEQCQKILKVKQWESDELRMEFEYGAKCGMGRVRNETKIHSILSILPKNHFIEVRRSVNFKNSKRE